MDLKTQLLNFYKNNPSFHLSVDMQHHEFRTRNGGHYSPGSIDRVIRILYQEGRLEKDDTGKWVKYRYKKSEYEKLHDKMSI